MRLAFKVRSQKGEQGPSRTDKGILLKQKKCKHTKGNNKHQDQEKLTCTAPSRFYKVPCRTMLPIFKDDPHLCSHVLASVRWTACCPVHSMHHGSHLTHNGRTRLGINNTPDTFSLFRMGRRDLSQWHNWKNQTCLWFKTTMRFCVCFCFSLFLSTLPRLESTQPSRNPTSCTASMPSVAGRNSAELNT